MCLAGKSEARLEASSFRCFMITFMNLFILLDLNLVNIISQNFLEITINFFEEIYENFLEFRQILGQQCETREFPSSNFSIKLFFRLNLEFFLYFFLDINIFF